MLLTKYWEADTVATGVRDAHFLLIGMPREYRRRGVASALIGHALRATADQNYEHAGFVPKQRHVRWELEARLE
jgi:mycothiol synthase